MNAGYLLISPESPFLEIGTNFTATCIIINTTEITADDLYWKQSNTIIAEEHYRKINRTAVSVTIAITGEKTELLFCHAKEVSINVFLNSGKFTHGITLTKGCTYSFYILSFNPQQCVYYFYVWSVSFPVQLGLKLSLKNSVTIFKPTVSLNWGR